ncbi:thiamine-phosphate kinase [Buchnera aphidicola]|uniref:thiamine-phosphate kinase n=1 Tax=Buchnera aphidicola TaxID=9 RepID=UPI003464C98C
MKYNEFNIISKFFKNQQKKDKNQITGIGDDSALIKIPKNNMLAISTDTLVEDIHFLKNTNPKDLAYKSVAVNLSDLAAMGAIPKWITLSMTMPKSDAKWLKIFSKSFFNILNKYKLKLIGGDTNCGPLSITISVYGLIHGNKSLLRSNAKNEDLIYVTGSLGESAAGCFLLQKKIFLRNINIRNFLIKKHLKPIPRINEGLLLKDIANSAIDISDGLISDLGHILKSSKCGANIDLNKIPISKNLKNNFKSSQYLDWALHTGEDYELCFTIPKKNIEKLNFSIKKKLIQCTCIGYITPIEKELNLTRNKKKIILNKTGFNHFI